MKLDLSIVILNYNTRVLMLQLLQSIQKNYLSSTAYKVEVIMVDNASTDDSVHSIKKAFPWVKIIEAKQNNGFADGNNLALRQAEGRYVMLLNSDTEFTADSQLDIVIEYLDKNSQVAVLTPRLELNTGELDPASHRGEPTPWASFCYFSGLAKSLPKSKFLAQYHQTYQDITQTHAIDACSGAAMVVRSSAMKEVGYLDESFFMYAEDLDWCRRFREKGYSVIFFPAVKILHHKYQSGMASGDQKTAEKTSRYFYLTMLQYYDKYYRTKYPELLRQGIKLFVHLKTKGGSI